MCNNTFTVFNNVFFPVFLKAAHLSCLSVYSTVVTVTTQNNIDHSIVTTMEFTETVTMQVTETVCTGSEFENLVLGYSVRVWVGHTN